MINDAKVVQQLSIQHKLPFRVHESWNFRGRSKFAVGSTPCKPSVVIDISHHKNVVNIVDDDSDIEIFEAKEAGITCPLLVRQFQKLICVQILPAYSVNLLCSSVQP